MDDNDGSLFFLGMLMGAFIGAMAVAFPLVGRIEALTRAAGQ